MYISQIMAFLKTHIAIGHNLRGLSRKHDTIERQR